MPFSTCLVRRPATLIETPASVEQPPEPAPLHVIGPESGAYYTDPQRPVGGKQSETRTGRRSTAHRTMTPKRSSRFKMVLPLSQTTPRPQPKLRPPHTSNLTRTTHGTLKQSRTQGISRAHQGRVGRFLSLFDFDALPDPCAPCRPPDDTHEHFPTRTMRTALLEHPP